MPHLACLLLLAPWSFVRCAGLGPNLMTNGDFEQGPWREENDIRPARADLMVSHGGLQSMRLDARPEVERYVYGPAFDVDPAKTYVLTAWLRCAGVTAPHGATLRLLQWSDKEPVGWVWNWEIGQGANPFLGTDGTHGWTRAAALLTKLDPRARRIAPFFALAAGSGVAWLDDVEVREWNGTQLPPDLAQPLADPADKGPRPEEVQPPIAFVSPPPDFDLAKLTCAPREAAGPNVLENGGFEQLPPADWGKTVSLDRQVKHGGEASLALGVTGDGYVASAPTVDSDLDYRFTAWIRTEGVPKDGLTLRLWPGWWNEATMSENLIVTGGSRDWTRYEIVMTNLPESLRGKRWWLHYSLKGAEGQPAPKAWLDDAELVPLADSVRVTSSKVGHFFVEGEPAKLSYTLRRVPAGQKRHLRWAATDFHGALVERRDADLVPRADGTAAAEIALPRRGYLDFTLVLEDGAGHALQGANVSAALLPKLPADATALKPDSIFACWGVTPELAPLLGVKWTRWVERGLYFDPVEGKPNEFTWNLKPYYGDYRPHEERLAERRAGLMTYLCFHAFGDWMLKRPDGSRGPVPQDWARFANWVEFIYRQVPDVVPVVEVWNEPVIPWGWQGTPEDIVTLHRTVYETVKRINPKVKVLGPCDSTEHLDTFGRLGGFHWVDALAIHPYRPSSPEATDFVGELKRIRAISAKYGGPQEIWITEMGWTTSPGRFTELEQANWVTRAYLLALSQGVRNLNVHIFGDWNNSSPSEKYYGLTRTDHTPKPAAVAYATLTRNLEGAHFVRMISGLGRAGYGCLFERSGQPLLVLWNAGREEMPATLAVGAAEVTVERLDGTADRVPAPAGRLRLDLGESPVFVHGAGRAAFPTKPGG